jgi:hypothetical protein
LLPNLRFGDQPPGTQKLLIPCRTIQSQSLLLFRPQRLHGIDGSGTACGNLRGDERDDQDRRWNQVEGDGVDWADLEEKAVSNTTERNGTLKTEDEAAWGISGDSV